MTPTEQMAADARDNGAALALDAESKKWLLEWAMTKTARAFPQFTSDELHGILQELNADELAHPNAVGALFLQAARAGIILNTGRVQKSARIPGRRRAVAIWESLIFRHPHITPEAL